MMQPALDFNAKPLAQRLADEGMNRAIDHAERIDPGWSERAYGMLTTYASSHTHFMTEEVRVWAHASGLPQPPDPRAWGAVTVRALKAGMIVRDHYRQTSIPPAHSTPRSVWRSNIVKK